MSSASRNGVAPARVDIGSIRRDEIIEAAIAIIAEQGIEHLSLSAIEKRAGMSRGQLTYYFRTKEKILLAVFDRLLVLMYQRISEGKDQHPPDPSGWDMTQHLLKAILLQPSANPEFHSLQYTFLSQLGHREDFRQRLAALYGEWRGFMALGLERDRRTGARPVPTRAMASLVQAILHGLAIQLVADPNAFDRLEMLTLCQEVLGNYLGLRANTSMKPAPKPRRLAKRRLRSGKSR